MKQFMKVFTMALAMGALIVGANAQAAGPKGGQGLGKGSQAKGLGGGGQRNMQRMLEVRNRVFAQLNLTAEQKSKIEAIDKKHRDAMQKLMQEPGDRQAKMPKFRELQTKHREEFQAVLTPAQRTRFQELMRAEMQKMREERGKAGSGGRPGGRGKGQGQQPPL